MTVAILAKLYIDDLVEDNLRHLYSRKDAENAEEVEALKEQAKDELLQFLGSLAEQYVKVDTLDQETGEKVAHVKGADGVWRVQTTTDDEPDD